LKSEFLAMDFSECAKCGELRFDKKVNRCVSCGYQN
jgi:ribosomal protein L37E